MSLSNKCCYKSFYTDSEQPLPNISAMPFLAVARFVQDPKRMVVFTHGTQ